MKSLNEIKNKLLRRNVSKAVRIQRTAACVVILLFVAIFVFAYIKYGNVLYKTFCDKKALEEFLGKFGGFDKVIFVLIRAFQTVIKIIPAEPLEIAAGAFYGVIQGTFLCVVGSFLGCLIIILITRKIGRKVVDLFVPIEIIDDFKIFKDKKRMYTTITLIYIIPSAPKDLLVYAAALMDINMWKFLLITTLARIPSIMISTWCGTEFINENYEKAIIIFIVSIVLACSLSIVYKKYTSKKSKQESFV